MSSIAYITVSAIPSRAANSVQVVNMAGALQRAGHELVLYAPYADAPPPPGVLRDFYGVDDGVTFRPIHRPGVRGGSHAFAVRAVRSARGHADVVYTRSAEVAFYATLARQRTILELHAPVATFRRPQRLLLRAVLRSRYLRRLVVISPYLRDDLAVRAPRTSVVVAPDAARVGDPPGPAPSDGRTDRLLVGYAGSLYRGRGVDTIVGVAARCGWAEFHVYGGSPEQVGDWAERTGDLPNIRFHGAIPPARVHGALVGCDVLMAPYERAVFTATNRLDTSRWMSPLKVFEYMAAGRAILCSDLPSLRDVMEHDVTAIFCEPGDFDAWAAALEALRDDPDSRARLGRRAIDLVRSRYSWAARANEVMEGVS